MTSHRSSSRVIREEVTADGRIQPIKGLGFGLSEIDDEAQQTRWDLKLPRRAFIEAHDGSVLVRFRDDTSKEELLAFRDQHFPHHTAVIWTASPTASNAEAATSGCRREFKGKSATVALKPLSKGQARRAGLKPKKRKKT